MKDLKSSYLSVPDKVGVKMKYVIEFMDGTTELIDVGEGGFIDYRGQYRWAHFIKQAGRDSVSGEMGYKEVASYPDCNIKKISSVEKVENKSQRVQEKT